MTPTLIWAFAGIVYGIFWFWYIGISRKITPEEVKNSMELLESRSDFAEKQIAAIRRFFEQDDGRDFVMVNLLELKEPLAESRKKLTAYQKIFLGNLLKRGGHPIFIARAASGNIEDIGCSADNWTAAGMVRYRSRRDLLEVLPDTVGSEHHRLKLDALERTFAYPAAPWMIVGGPKLLAPMALALIAALVHLALL
ncbi:MAG: hypothetical protein ACI9FR_002558 [Cryomorphaceae bacterium]|jgi:hypothetical protein